MKAIIWEMIVAMAAPWTPRPNPKSKMKIGSKRILTPVPIIIEIIATFALPSALVRLLRTIEKDNGIKPIRMTDIYCLA